MKKENLIVEEEIEIQKQNIGNAGEYYIASRLSAENFVATITLGRAEKYDILTINPKGKTLKISVKTRFAEENVRRFPLSEKDELGASGDFFYAFVKLNKFNKEPDFWIIPSKIVSKIVADSHHYYINQKGRNGEMHNDSKLRNLWIEDSASVDRTYPKRWRSMLRGYYKNIEQLKNV
jgi:hypothetical protein